MSNDFVYFRDNRDTTGAYTDISNNEAPEKIFIKINEIKIEVVGTIGSTPTSGTNNKNCSKSNNKSKNLREKGEKCDKNKDKGEENSDKNDSKSNKNNNSSNDSKDKSRK